jgi:hypothetical protein
MAAEKNLDQAVERLLHQRRAWAVKIHGAGVSRNGIPDWLVCHLGHFLAIEDKAPGARPTKLQAYELEQIACAGGIAIVAHHVDDVRRALDEIEADDQALAA